MTIRETEAGGQRNERLGTWRANNTAVRAQGADRQSRGGSEEQVAPGPSGARGCGPRARPPRHPSCSPPRGQPGMEQGEDQPDQSLSHGTRGARPVGLQDSGQREGSLASKEGKGREAPGTAWLQRGQSPERRSPRNSVPHRTLHALQERTSHTCRRRRFPGTGAPDKGQDRGRGCG